MRHILLINVFFFSSLIAHEQIKFNNVSSRYKDDSVLYTGVENYIEITGIGPKAGRTLLNVTHGEIASGEGNKYVVRVYAREPDTLKFYQNSRLRLQKVFTVKSIPHLVARLANSNDTILSTSQIKLNPFLTAVLPDCNYKHDFQIISFSATIIPANGDTIPFSGINGNYLSRELLLTIEELNHNDKILFEDIRAISPDSRNLKLPKLLITIK